GGWRSFRAVRVQGALPVSNVGNFPFGRQGSLRLLSHGQIGGKEKNPLPAPLLLSSLLLLPSLKPWNNTSRTSLLITPRDQQQRGAKVQMRGTRQKFYQAEIGTQNPCILRDSYS